MKILIVKQLLPVAVFAATALGSLAGGLVGKSDTVALVPSYIKLNPAGTSCELQSIQCETTNTGNTCSVSGTTVWGMNEHGACVREVFRP